VRVWHHVVLLVADLSVVEYSAAKRCWDAAISWRFKKKYDFVTHRWRKLLPSYRVRKVVFGESLVNGEIRPCADGHLPTAFISGAAPNFWATSYRAQEAFVNARRQEHRQITRDEDDVDSAAWRQARERAADVRALAGNGILSRDGAQQLSERWGISRATVWRRVSRFLREGSLRAFLDQPRGVKPGTKGISQSVDSVIRDAALSWWRETENATIAEIFPTVVGECKAREMPAPSRATVARRLSVLRADPASFSGEVRKALRERTRLMKGSYTVSQPLAVVQIDHTIADAFVICPYSRLCIGRPTFTVAIDIGSRSVLGMCLSLEAPSALLVALCLEHAVFPKVEWLQGIGVQVEWPQHGKMAALHCDNGREFHSAGFRRGCDLNSIDTIYRPPATPRFGGHVERLIGTLMRRVRLLPGSSYSDLLGKGPSRAELRAALTLSDLRAILVEDIARYHARVHRSLRRSPRSVWEAAWVNASPVVPADPLKFRCEFLPLRQRVVGREGIELFHLNYSCGDLAPEVALGIKRMVRFDPRDISRVYLERKDAAPLPVPLRDRALPPMSLWEWDAVRRRSGGVIERADAERVQRELQASSPAVAAPELSTLKKRRRAAREATWREVQALAALPIPNIALEPTLESSEEAGAFAWEVLE
jgi:putative transposase